MVVHPDIDKIAFTGHVDTAKIIQKAAADTLKRTTFELGGKSPNVIFADADLDAAVAGAFHAIYFHGGQCCTAGSRLFVEEKIHQEFVERLAEKAKGRKVGDPLDPTTEQGPQVSQEQLDKILGYVELGEKQGAHAPDRRRAGRQEGLLRRADDLRQRQGRHGDRQGRDLRSRGQRPAVQGRRRGDRAGQQHLSTAWPPRSGPRTSTRPTCTPRRSRPAPSGSTAITSSTRPRRSAASRCPARAARTARRLWSTTPS